MKIFRREIIEAMVVSAEEVSTNPAFSLLKERDRNCCRSNVNTFWM